MGCCTSTDSSAPLNTKAASHTSPNNANTAKKEDKIELAFKVKRANIFTEGVDLGREAFVQKRIAKSEKQLKVISKFKYRLPLHISMLTQSTLTFLFSGCDLVQLHLRVPKRAGP